MSKHTYLAIPLIVLLVSCASSSGATSATAGATTSALVEFPTTQPGRGQIRGIVLDASSGAPITGANITTDPPTSSVTTGADGSYSITDAKSGSYTITASKGGYASTAAEIAVTADKTTTADLQLALNTTATLPPPAPTPTSNATPTSTMQPVEVSVMCSVYGQSSVHVKQGTPIIFTWQWMAAREDLIPQHVEAAIYRVLLDGNEIQANRIGPIEYVSEKNWYAVTWYADPIILDIGEHLTERNLSWLYQITDGWNTYGPEGKYETLHDTCTIIVE